MLYVDGGQLVYFEVDEVSGNLLECQKKILDTEVKCLDIGEVPEGRTRTKFLAVGFGDSTFKILGLDSDSSSCLQRISLQALPAVPDSICFMKSCGDSDSLYLHVGLSSGVLVRSLVDSITGSISDTRQQFLGTRSVKLAKITVNKNEAVIALSNRPFLSYIYMKRYQVIPLNYPSLSSVSPFTSERCADGGLVAIADNTLRIIQIEKLGEKFTYSQLRTKYTPCRLIVHPDSGYLCVLEKDHNAFSS